MPANSQQASRPLILRQKWTIGLLVKCGQQVENIVVYFPDRNYLYKSVPPQISYDAGFSPIPGTLQKSSLTKDQTSDAFRSKNSKQYALN